MKKRQEWFQRFLFALVSVLIMAAPQRGEAKRALPEVKPVEVNGYRYTAPHTEMGVIEVYEIKTGKKCWDMRVYRVRIDLELDEDEQGIFVKELKLDQDHLVVIDETEREFPIPLDLMDSWGGEGYDGSARFRLFFARYKMESLEFWVDDEETVDGIGEVKFVGESGNIASTKQCSKGQKHEKAPWVCYLPKDQLQQFEMGEEGKIKIFDLSGNLKIEDERDFTSFKIFAETRVRFY